jgi:hypothetical protein
MRAACPFIFLGVPHPPAARTTVLAQKLRALRGPTGHLVAARLPPHPLCRSFSTDCACPLSVCPLCPAPGVSAVACPSSRVSCPGVEIL